MMVAASKCSHSYSGILHDEEDDQYDEDVMLIIFLINILDQHVEEDGKHDEEDDKHDEEDDQHDEEDDQYDEEDDKHDEEDDQYDEEYDQHDEEYDQHDEEYDQHDEEHDQYDEEDDQYDEEDDQHDEDDDQYDEEYDQYDEEDDQHDEENDQYDEEDDQHDEEDDQYDEEDDQYDEEDDQHLIDLTAGIINFLKLHRKQNLEDLAKTLSNKTSAVSLGDSAITVKGRKKDVDLVVNDIKQITDQLVTSSYMVRKPGIPKLFYQAIGVLYVEDAGRKTEVFIEIPHRHGKEQNRPVSGPSPRVTVEEATDLVKTDEGRSLRQGSLHNPEREPGIPQGLTSLTLSIYADSKTAIDKSKARLDHFCEENYKEIVITDPFVKKLTPLHLRLMEDIAERYEVQLNVQKDLYPCHISLKGYTKDVLESCSNIHEQLRELKDKERDQAEAEMIAQQVSWCYMEGTLFKSYTKELNALLERSYKEKATYARWTGKDGVTHTVDFNRMVQDQGLKTEIRVKRISSVVGLPSCWGKMNENYCISVRLDPSSPEYKDIVTRLQETAPCNITQIHRIQNPTLYRQYIIKKQQMCPKDEEKCLWHGTRNECIDSINRNGFNRSFSRNRAADQRYGKGTYFAVDASFSVDYAKPDESGSRVMYQCKVLTGEYTKGKPSMNVPPPKHPSVPEVLYDSLVNKLHNPTIFVIFHDTQVYPEYLITFIKQ